jgi:hypothetical protein
MSSRIKKRDKQLYINFVNSDEIQQYLNLLPKSCQLRVLGNLFKERFGFEISKSQYKIGGKTGDLLFSLYFYASEPSFYTKTATSSSFTHDIRDISNSLEIKLYVFQRREFNCTPPWIK